MPSLNETVARRVKHLRQQAGMTQEQFAGALGASRRNVMRWEKGEVLPNAESQKRIAALTGQELIDEASRERAESDDDSEDDLLFALMERWAKKRGRKLVVA